MEAASASLPICIPSSPPSTCCLPHPLHPPAFQGLSRLWGMSPFPSARCSGCLQVVCKNGPGASSEVTASLSLQPQYKVADPISTFLFSVCALGSTAPTLRDVLLVLMEGEFGTDASLPGSPSAPTPSPKHWEKADSWGLVRKKPQVNGVGKKGLRRVESGGAVPEQGSLWQEHGGVSCRRPSKCGI